MCKKKFLFKIHLTFRPVFGVSHAAGSFARVDYRQVASFDRLLEYVAVMPGVVRSVLVVAVRGRTA